MVVYHICSLRKAAPYTKDQEIPHEPISVATDDASRSFGSGRPDLRFDELVAQAYRWVPETASRISARCAGRVRRYEE